MKNIQKRRWIVAFAILAVVLGLIIYSINYRTYDVSFYSDENVVLKVDLVKMNASAVPPEEPQMSYGKIFKSWDTEFSRVKRNIEVHPICEDVIDKNNVFAISGAYGNQGEMVIVPLKLCGDVCLAGFDITVSFDAEKLHFVETLEEDGAVLCNEEQPGTIRINYVSTKNTIADVDICKLKIKIISEEKEGIPFNLKVNSIYALKDSDDLKSTEMYIPEVEIINGSVFVIS